METMSCKSTFLSLLFYFFLMIHNFVSADPLFYTCSGGNLQSSSPYTDNNLISLVRDLTITAPLFNFGVGTAGNGQDKDQAYGLALCRGDVSSQDCATCVGQASKDSLNLCQTKSTAVLWYDHCLYKYANWNFLGQIDDQNKFSLFSGVVARNPTSFNQKTSSFLTTLALKASGNTPTYFATGVSGPVDGSVKLFGLAQCTWDLQSDDCYTCLAEIINNEIPSCCSGKLGARIYYGSCYIRYETFNFFGS